MKSIIYLFLLITISIGIIIAFSFGLKLLENYSSFWTYLMTYFVFTIGLNILSIKINNKYIGKITTIFSYPIAIFFFLIQFTTPIVVIYGHIFYYLLLTIALPFFLIQLNKCFEYQELNTETETFLQLTLSIIIAITFHKLILAITYKRIYI